MLAGVLTKAADIVNEMVRVFRHKINQLLKNHERMAEDVETWGAAFLIELGVPRPSGFECQGF